MSRYFFVLLFLLIGSVQASTYNVQTSGLWYATGTAQYSGATASESCNKIGISLGLSSGQWGPNQFSSKTNSQLTHVCLATNNQPSSYSVTVAIWCPYGGTSNGTSCLNAPECSAGQTRNVSTGQCQAPCGDGFTRSPTTGQCVYNCSSVQGWVGGQCVDCAGRTDGGFSGAYSWANSPGSAAPAGGCGSNFCFYPTVAKVQQGTKNVFQFASGSSGQSCTPGADAGTPSTSNVQTPATNTPEGCLAQGKGYVTGSSGTTSCVNASDAPTSTPVKTTTTDTTKTTGTTGTTTTETSNTTTECSGGNCTTTKATTTGAGTTTTQETETADSYCQKNPNAPMCKQKDDPCKDHPERIGCSEFGDPVEGDALGTKQIGTSSISTVSLGSNATCPSDVNIRNGIKVSYEWVCMYANGLRPVILALAWLSAGFLIFGMKLE